MQQVIVKKVVELTEKRYLTQTSGKSFCEKWYLQ